jgi:hypothetical protein
MIFSFIQRFCDERVEIVHHLNLQCVEDAWHDQTGLPDSIIVLLRIRCKLNVNRCTKRE